MAEHIVDAFIVKWALDRGDFNKGVEEVEAGTKRLKESQRKSFGEIEQAGARAGEAVIGLSRNVVGLGLAFMGASSLVGFTKDMLNGAASADRFGQTLGMSVQKVYAWRQAMKAMNGDASEGDASLQRIQSLKMGLQNRTIDPQAMMILGRLGISTSDLRSKDSGEILEQMSRSTGKLSPQRQANLMQQLGLSQSTIYFLQQGQDQVHDMLGQFARNADAQAALSKDAESLQVSMTELKSSFEGVLAPLLQQIVPELTAIANWAKAALGGVDNPKNGSEWGQRIAGDILTGKHNAWQDLYEYLGPEKGAWIPDSWKKGANAGGSAGAAAPAGGAAITGPRDWNPARAPRGQRAVALDGNNPGGINDGPWARRQAGYVGNNGRYAAFSTLADGMAAQRALLKSYVDRGYDTPSKIAHRWAPRRDHNNPVAYAQNIAHQLGIGVNDRISSAHLGVFQQAQAATENGRFRSMAGMSRSAASARGGGSGNVNIGAITINTQAKNATEIARNLPAELKRRGVIIRANQGIQP